ncbi:3'-5'-exoribonuclease [Ascosphaera pollenicola]|nr:3'-5'-exoribonuclease [Ascosphaera pollenicola]
MAVANEENSVVVTQNSKRALPKSVVFMILSDDNITSERSCSHNMKPEAKARKEALINNFTRTSTGMNGMTETVQALSASVKRKAEIGRTEIIEVIDKQMKYLEDISKCLAEQSESLATLKQLVEAQNK